MSKWENTPYNILGVRHTTLVFLICRLQVRTSVITRLSYPRLLPTFPLGGKVSRIALMEIRA